eukprot:TRINITY_DN15398_c0_g1_i3.p2 TRINITY_DN15398_c0_g1~~TRINITY_DN15398_c0_g1_i3.p2  ORF type:complete len:108 (+),score=13.31 TRINITY_DN15398_c0_g1_i3:294-617(+)
MHREKEMLRVKFGKRTFCYMGFLENRERDFFELFVKIHGGGADTEYVADCFSENVGAMTDEAMLRELYGAEVRRQEAKNRRKEERRIAKDKEKVDADEGGGDAAQVT